MLPEDVDAAGPQVSPPSNRRFLDDVADLLLFHLTQKTCRSSWHFGIPKAVLKWFVVKAYTLIISKSMHEMMGDK